MKKLFALFSAILLSFAVHAEKYPEGDYYQVLSTPKTSTPTVTEFFSFYCPHCNDFEPIAQDLKKHVEEEKVQFKKSPVSFMGGPVMGKAMSKGYATMESLGIEDKMVPVMFNRIHTMRKPPKTEEELKQIFLDEGVSEEDFDGTYNSFAINSMVTRFDKAFKDTGLTGVPSFVVNGKYSINLEKIQTPEQLFEVVDQVLAKE